MPSVPDEDDNGAGILCGLVGVVAQQTTLLVIATNATTTTTTAAQHRPQGMDARGSVCVCVYVASRVSPFLACLAGLQNNLAPIACAGRASLKF